MSDWFRSSRWYRRRTVIPAAMVLAALILLGVYAGLSAMLSRSAEAEARLAAAATVAPYASSLGNAINARLASVRGLVAFVTAQAAQKDFGPLFATYAQELRRGVPGIRNVGVAPDFVVRYINPVEGNESTLGHEFLNDPRPGFVADVLRSIETRDIVTHGPLPLIQGGEGLIARHAVFIDGAVWGAVGVVFDMQPILDQADLASLPAAYDFAIRRGGGEVVLGNPEVFGRDPEIGAIPLPDGAWHLAVVPRRGWQAPPDPVFGAVFLGAALLMQLVLFLGLDRHFTLIGQLQERVANEAILRHARDVAEEATAAKSRFLAAASHDLRQPVHTLRLLLSAIEDVRAETHPDEPAEVADLFDEMDMAVGTLAELLHTLLDVSRLDAGIVAPEVAAVPVLSLLHRLEAQFRRQAATHGVRLRVVPSSCFIRTDAGLLAQVLSNMVSNAIKFSPGGTVLVGCRRRGGTLEIQVWDTGIGIAPDMIGAIFEEFRQVGNDARQRELGLGLGLAIAKRTADLLGHRLRVGSRLGHGSVFAVAVPVIPPPA